MYIYRLRPKNKKGDKMSREKEIISGSRDNFRKEIERALKQGDLDSFQYYLLTILVDIRFEIFNLRPEED